MIALITAAATATTTINPVFLREIKEDNHELKRLLGQARRLCARGKWGRYCRRRLAGVLACLRDQLAMHFSLEEAYGYFDEPVSEAPHLCNQANALRKEHPALYLNICDVADRAEQFACEHPSRCDAGDIIREFQAFDKEFHDHEQDERELMMRAFDEDLGVGD